MKEKIIIAVLSVVFLVVLFGAFWDLYGKNHIHICINCEQTNTTTTGVVTPVNVATSSATKAKGDKSDKTNSPITNLNVDSSAYSQCLQNTKSLPESKDCCDCLSADVATRKACRDAAATYDFTKNTTFKSFTIPSKLGRSGDYSACTSSGNQQQCKQCCDSSNQYACGDFQYCRTACDSLSK